MNTSNITIYKIPFGTEAWHRYRTIGLSPEDAAQFNCPQFKGGVGSSEGGTILGLTKKYRPCTQEIFHHKVGTAFPTQTANRAMLRGKILESVVATIWQLSSSDDDAWVQVYEEYMNGNREVRNMLAVRKATKRNAYYVNEEYPWLFCSLDYFAEKGTPGILDGKIHDEGFPVEIKTVNQNYARLWEAGIPVYHIVQLNQEMICTNSEYGEIAVLFPDDFTFKVFPFYRDKELCDRIIHWSKIFWDKVLESREAKKQMDNFSVKGNKDKADEMQSIIDSNEPEPDDGEGYMEYIKERYTQSIVSTEGNSQMYDESMTYKLCAGVSALLDEKQTGIKNRFLKTLEATGAAEITFDALGKITFNADKNGKRTLRIDTKSLYPIKQKAEDEFNKIDFNLNPL